MEIAVRSLIPSDFLKVASIYKAGIATGMATFETKVPSWDVWDNKYIDTCRIVAEVEGQVVGFAVLSQVSQREVYSGVAEVSVYVAEAFRGKGVGKLLLRQLVSMSETNGYWTLQAGIFPKNLSSIKLHEACGFRILGVREKIGQSHGIWYDNVLMERRSKIIN
ncbi:MAG: N-acetyltransferase [Flavobacteriaceae bacterium]|nr:N-acetyltransferase [Flavobacteriaceae bacterium]